jgi:hypothetical protein
MKKIALQTVLLTMISMSAHAQVPRQITCDDVATGVRVLAFSAQQIEASAQTAQYDLVVRAARIDDVGSMKITDRQGHSVLAERSDEVLTASLTEAQSATLSGQSGTRRGAAALKLNGAVTSADIQSNERRGQSQMTITFGRFHVGEPGNFINVSHRSVSDVMFS